MLALPSARRHSFRQTEHEGDPLSTLASGSSLTAGQAGITSPNGRYTLALTADGDLAVTDANGAVAWSTGTDGKDAARADMQADGNLVLYTADNGVVWASDTGEARSVLELQDDRNLVMYSTGRAVVWGPNSSISAEEKADADAAAAASAPAPVAPAERRYTVRSGDTLSKIAREFYGNAGDYMRIAQANNIADPDLIHPGQDLVIP